MRFFSEHLLFALAKCHLFFLRQRGFSKWSLRSFCCRLKCHLLLRCLMQGLLAFTLAGHLTFHQRSHSYSQLSSIHLSHNEYNTSRCNKFMSFCFILAVRCHIPISRLPGGPMNSENRMKCRGRVSNKDRQHNACLLLALKMAKTVHQGDVL